MKKRLLSIALLFTVIQTYADEGMWLPMLLGQQVYNDMVKRGLKLKPEQLYSVNKSSLKDAIIIFGNGCTGEIVSPQGLIFTNHHCGYGQIAAASTVSHKLAFDKDLNRTVCVDARYVLWCIEKLGGAKHIINELTIVQ